MREKVYTKGERERRGKEKVQLWQKVAKRYFEDFTLLDISQRQKISKGVKCSVQDGLAKRLSGL
jgi:hypothetical protein